MVTRKLYIQQNRKKEKYKSVNHLQKECYVASGEFSNNDIIKYFLKILCCLVTRGAHFLIRVHNHNFAIISNDTLMVL